MGIFGHRSPKPTPKIAPGLWKRAADRLPERTPIDVFYVNPTFDPPASGIVKNVYVVNSMINTMEGLSIPSCYIEFWKQSLNS